MSKMGHGIDASWFYENLHLGTPGDAEFYARVVTDAESVLELGGGTGRLARALATLVPRYEVLELNPSLAQFLKTNLGETLTAIHEADMRTFALTGRFDRVLLPYNALYCAGGAEGALALFSRVSAHLSEEGEFWFDAYSIDAYHDALLAGEASTEPEPPEVVLRTPWQGQIIEVTESTEVNAAAQRLSVTYRAFLQGEEVAAEQLFHDYLTASQIRTLLAQAGLVPSAIFGDFEGSKVDEDSGHLVVCATSTS